ncbi:MAG: hypothetical protein OYM47_17055 [Gemmatimonadota bacterium]|nr:hypothetical protein [Gemmatimonadota bacterium]
MDTNDRKRFGLNHRVQRDRQNAEFVIEVARSKLGRLRTPQTDSRFGVTKSHKSRMEHLDRDRKSLKAIADEAFHVMVEVYTKSADISGRPLEREQLWYANTNSKANEVLSSDGQSVNVLAWTHPGLQSALALGIGEVKDISANGYRLLSVKPRAKARFDSLFPDLSGVYQPGGAVRPRTTARPKTGLKAVKLDMTPDQVSAFISRMSGLMLVTGAPGSGKTTVAFQRIRFLYDQQDERQEHSRLVTYSPDLTRVFLANDNLVEHAKNLLIDQLNIPEFVVEPVNEFIERYLDHAWVFKHSARPRQRRLSRLESAARAAVLGLSDHYDLGRLWEVYERQIASRLESVTDAPWMTVNQDKHSALRTLAGDLSSHGNRTRIGSDPLRSELSMKAVFSAVVDSYTKARASMSAESGARFDTFFLQWLYAVYDPLSALMSYFGDMKSEAAVRMRRGTGDRVDEADVLGSAVKDWSDRLYGPEDRPWLAWLLRFALPETSEFGLKFREVPSAIGLALHGDQRWTHVVIDEAQDLCVAEASLIGSLVDPDGALTVSSDFRQIVSPVHGMTSPKALHVGHSLRGPGTDQIYLFARNIRQSRQIGRFLQGFYEVAFKERPSFDVNETLEDKKPQLIITPPHDQALRISQLVAVLRRSDVVQSVALIQINEDEQALSRLRSELANLNVPLAREWEPSGDGLITTSVERIKGLEFDACIVLGLEGVKSASLNFTRERAYVGLSRPTRRLGLIAEEYPSVLRGVSRDLFDVTQS